jgi:tripartite-type tricarboxylate transporter receptor subunit TctC
VSWDPLRDFAPITAAASAPNIIVVPPWLVANSVRELIALAKARPGELNYGSGGSGSTPHLAAELFKAMAGVNIMRIPYKGTGPAFIDLMAGRLHVMFPSATSAAPNIKSGKVRALAVGSVEPSELAPGVPTVAASGLPGYESVSIFGVFAPAKTPEAIIKRLNMDIVRFLRSAEAKERFFSAGTEIIGSSPEQLAATMKSEMTRLGKVIKDAAIRE